MENLFDEIAGGEFKVLCNLSSGAPEWDFDSGLPHLQELYGGQYWRGDDGHIDFEKVEREVPKLAGTLLNDMLCIDVEGEAWGAKHPGSGDHAEWQAANDEFKRLVEVLRRLLPGVKLSWHASCPSLQPWYMNGFHGSRKEGQYGKPWRRWLLATEFLEFQRSLAGLLDFGAPSCYWKAAHWYFAHDRGSYMRRQFTDQWGSVSPLFEQQQTSALQAWITITVYSLQYARSMMPRKPLICHISNQWWTDPAESPSKYDAPLEGELVYPSWIIKALDAVRPHCDAVAVWIHPHNVGGFTAEQYLDSQGWQAIREWAAEQNGE